MRRSRWMSGPGLPSSVTASPLRRVFVVSRTVVLLAVLVVVVAACGGGGGESDNGASSDDGGSDSGGSPSGGDVVDPQPAGQAKATVDGLEYTFTEPGGVDCAVAENEFSFSFVIGDNEVVLGGGGFRSSSDDEWLTSPDLRVFNPDSEPGPISYFPVADSVEIAIDGNSVSITGPMQKQPANDGSNPPPVDVGEGTFTFTCP